MQEEIKVAMNNVASWAARRSAGTPAVMLPGKSYIKCEPLGTCLIIGPWNYPRESPRPCEAGLARAP